MTPRPYSGTRIYQALAEQKGFTRRGPRAASAVAERAGGYRCGSRQREEHSLQLFLGHGSLTVTGEALPHASGDNLEPRPVERPGTRRQLRHDIRTITPRLDHRDHPGELSLRPAKPVQHRPGGGVIDLHEPISPTISAP